MNYNRNSGILLHISSLPSPWGIGDVGHYAKVFADFLYDAGFHAWQILPLSPVSSKSFYSPYSSSSAFAGAAIFISPEQLVKDGLISIDDVKSIPNIAPDKADYAYATKVKNALLCTAWKNFSTNIDVFNNLNNEFEIYRQKEQYWLDDYAVFIVLRENFDSVTWNKWPEKYRMHDTEALNAFANDVRNADRISYVRFEQFIFSRQLHLLHDYCKQKNIELIGDMPMFMSLDSADVWAHQDYFDLNGLGYPNCVAGVPPDYFSNMGQKWGNPLYNWDQMEKDRFGWWIQRIKRALEYYDTLRIDHFRGFCACWAVPAHAENAVIGTWRNVPGYNFFNAIMPEIDDREMTLIAEDLGIITDDVRGLMEKNDLPGMKVLLFAFGENMASNPYAPHNITNNSVIYTGTHDNNTVCGWLNDEVSECEIYNLKTYFGQNVTKENIADMLIKTALSSVARLAIIPMQDILSLGSNCRMNKPGTTTGNWEWRLSVEQFNKLLSTDNDSICSKYVKLNATCGR